MRRLSRPHTSGGTSIELAAVVAEGAASAEIIAWIAAHDGAPEGGEQAEPSRGLHGAWRAGQGAAAKQPPRRYLLPTGAAVEQISPE